MACANSGFNFNSIIETISVILQIQILLHLVNTYRKCSLQLTNTYEISTAESFKESIHELSFFAIINDI